METDNIKKVEEPQPFSFAEEIEFAQKGLLENLKYCTEMVENKEYNFLHLPDEAQTKEGCMGFMAGLCFAIDVLDQEQISKIINIVRMKNNDPEIGHLQEQKEKICAMVKELEKQHRKIATNEINQ